MTEELSNIYYDTGHPAGYRGVRPLLETTRKKFSNAIVSEWIQSQDTYTLHKPARKRFPRNRFVVYTINELWQCDLIDMRGLSRFNDGVNYILTVIDIFSKKAFAKPLIRKTASEIIKAFNSIFAEADTLPKNLQSDKGTEFTAKEVKTFLSDNNVNYFTTKNPDVKAAVVERFNRTLKTRMWRYLTHKNTYRYIDSLEKLIYSYNRTRHTSIKMRPIDVNKSNSFKVWITLYGKHEKIIKPKLKVNDFVRISKMKGTFEKGYETNWSDEIYKITKYINFPKPMYSLCDLNSDPIDGFFYEQELQKVVVTKNKTFKIDKILATKGKGCSKKYLVKWYGYSDAFNSWISATDLEEI